MTQQDVIQKIRNTYKDEPKNILLNRAMFDTYGFLITAVFDKLCREAQYNIEHHRDKNGWFYLHLNYICEYVGATKLSIRKALEQLEQDGFILVKREKFKNNWFYIVPEKWENYPKKIIDNNTVLESNTVSVLESNTVSVLESNTDDYANFSHISYRDSDVIFGPFNNNTINNNTINNKTNFPPPQGEGIQFEENKIKIKNKQPNKEQAKQPNGGSAAKGKKVKRTTHPGQIKVGNSANGGSAATGKISPAPVQGLGLTAKFPREVIRLAKWWYAEVSPRWLTVRRKGWEGCAHDWCKGIMKVTTGPNALCTFERLKILLQWALTNTFYSKNIRNLSCLNKKWNNNKDYMLDILSDEYDEEHKQKPKKQEQPFDIHDEIPQLVRDTLAEKYNIHEECFDDICKNFEKHLAEIWDWLDKQNNKQSPENKQNWLYGPICADKFKQVVQLWNDFGRGSPDTGEYSAWWWFWHKVERWHENEIPKGKPGPWIIDNLKSYVSKQ